MSDQVRRVAVIGAGATGLIALKILLSSDRKYIPTCFERGSDVGGVWKYSENTDTDEYGMPRFAGVYRDLISNIPRPMMEFPEFPNTEPETDSSFMDREEVLKYLKRFTDHFNLRQYIKSHTFVTKVRPNSDERHPEWTVSYYDIQNKTEQKQAVFDAVLVCNGHNDKPYIPDIAGVEMFQGEVSHSRNYRIPEKYTDKRVILLGASYSGLDLANDLSPYAQQIFLSHNNDRIQAEFPNNVTEKHGIKRMTRTTVVFLDDTEEEVDVLIFCTGYLQNFPFLSDDVINVTNNRVMPLYKHVVNIKYQNLFVIGLFELVPHFPMAHLMSKFAVAVLDGKVALPSEKDMHEDAESDFKDRIRRGQKPHADIGDEEIWNYQLELAKMAGTKPPPKAFRLIRNFLISNIVPKFTTFRQTKIEISDDMESLKIVN